MNKVETSDEFEYIFVAKITLRNGKVLYAKNCGKKAFRIRVKTKK